MGYSALNKIDETKITRLGFTAEPCNYIYEGPEGDKRKGTIYKVEEGIYDQIIEILEGDDNHTISKNDKVFVLPGHPLAAERIRTYLKRIGANITKNVNIATIIAGTDEFHTEKRWNEQAKFLHMMMCWKDGYKVTKNMEHLIDDTYDELVNVPIDKSIPTYISGPVGRYMDDPNIELEGKGLHFMTPLSIDVLYNVLFRKLKVVTTITIADDANSEMKLADDKTYHSIHSMLNSNDTTNRKMGLSLLFHSDLRGDVIYNVWRLADDFGNLIKYADKSKSRDHFLERTDFYKLSSMDQSEFLNFVYDSDFLNTKILNELIPKIQESSLQTVDYNIDEDFYKYDKLENGDIIIRLKDKWKEVKQINTEEHESAKL